MSTKLTILLCFPHQQCVPLTLPWLLVSITANAAFIPHLSFLLTIFSSLFFLFLTLSFVPYKIQWSWRACATENDWRPNTSKHQVKAKVGRFQSPAELQPNPPGESYQIVLTLHVICMEQTEGWLIVFADVLPIGNLRSLHGVANCNYNSSENFTTSGRGWCIYWTVLEKKNCQASS